MSYDCNNFSLEGDTQKRSMAEHYHSENFTSGSWLERWATDNIGWHLTTPNTGLSDNWADFCPDGHEPYVFVPLCGKSVDMLWLYETKGCTVVGCDISRIALDRFQLEHPELKLRASPVAFKNGDMVKCYMTTDNRMRLYLCDLFTMDKSPENPYKLIWDRGSFVAVDPQLRTRYISLIVSLCASDVRWLLSTYDYTPGAHSGPPTSTSEEEMADLFKDQTFMKQTLRYEDFRHEILAKATYSRDRVTLLTLRGFH